MARSFFAALFAAGTICAPVQAPARAAAIQPSPDSAEERKALRDLSACLAQARPRWARETLSQPYLSGEQASIAARALVGRDQCIRGAEAEIRFRTSSMVGSLAEHFLGTEIQRTDSAGLAKALSTLTPLNASEDFALCVAARNPGAARDLALSDPGSDVESGAAARLAAYVEPCTAQGEQLTVDLQSLRALVSTALYRGVASLGGAN